MLPLSSVSKLEISLGVGRHASAEKVAISLGIIGAIGGGIAVGTSDEIGAGPPGGILGALVFGGIGYIVGAIIGGLAAGEQWEEVEDPFKGLTVLPGRQSGFSLSLSRRF